MSTTPGYPLDGGCDCKGVRYRMQEKPLIVHCCHCRWCQRETGSAFVINALIEDDQVELVAGTPEVIHTPSNSGRGQNIARCPSCKIALWSVYSMPVFRFVRVGTLDNPDIVPPDVHIFTSSKQPWVVLPPNAPAFTEYYDSAKVWSAESLKRRAAALAKPA